MEKLINHLKDHLAGKLHGAARSGHWSTVRHLYLLAHPTCALCGGKDKLEVHHIRPFHTHPELELDLNNLITLCESKSYGVNCHLLFGHYGSYKNINIQVLEDVKAWSARIRKVA